MQYFVLQADVSSNNPLQAGITKEQLQQSKPFVVLTSLQEETYPDFFVVKKMFTYGFFVSHPLKEILEAYTEFVTAVPVFFMDVEQQEQKTYWNVQLPCADCVNSQLFIKIEDILLQPSLIPQMHAFQISFDRRSYLIVSFSLMEHMIRSGFVGMQFIPIANST